MLKTILKCISKQKLIKYIMWFKSYEHFHQLNMTGQTGHRFAYQCLNNVKMNKYAKFDQNILAVQELVKIFTKRP